VNFYFFNSHIEDIEELKAHKFYGGLFIYDVPLGDRFTKIARIIDSDIEMRYLVAIRPYVVSPQYLCMVCILEDFKSTLLLVVGIYKEK